MYEIVLLNNETGKSFTVSYNSYYIYNKDLIKFKHSNKLSIISYGEAV